MKPILEKIDMQISKLREGIPKFLSIKREREKGILGKLKIQIFRVYLNVRFN